MNNASEKKLALTHFWVAFGAFAVACLMGIYQVIVQVPATLTPGAYPVRGPLTATAWSARSPRRPRARRAYPHPFPRGACCAGSP